MPVAHYKIDSSLLLLRTGSIFVCQCGLWRDENKTSPYWCAWQSSIVCAMLLAAGWWALLKAPGGFLQTSTVLPVCALLTSYALVPAWRKVSSCGAVSSSKPPPSPQGHSGTSMHLTEVYPHCGTVLGRQLCSECSWMLWLWLSAEPVLKQRTCKMRKE